ncbi:MAG: hypothetical protein KI785_10795 [Devosiaceae bacterium]|nr:hypothetical protein [Devosiaceae bacterium MH13]
MSLPHAPLIGASGAVGVLAFPDIALAAQVDLGWAVDLVSHFIETGLIAAAATIIGWLASRVNRWVGLEIEREHSEALHAALARGVRHAVSLVRAEAKRRAVVDVESRVIAETAQYLEQLMPDALAYFQLDDGAMDRLIRAYLSPDVLHWAQQADVGAARVKPASPPNVAAENAGG